MQSFLQRTFSQAGGLGSCSKIGHLISSEVRSVNDVSQQVQGAIHNMLKMTSEIEQSSCEIMEEIEKCKESVAVRNNILEEERDRFKKAAMALLEMLNGILYISIGFVQ
ncbi:uncharacterized protein LOC109716129 [Ananas comosus]|uniref:Uncharacterized protein LOC109716129 n=1 Tax=Ananas comosus TaxID=4615 RepID=A0A6P5FU45_ANACO|nr:uncharacterized protein LOC109716129 [Ananas comosus]